MCWRTKLDTFLFKIALLYWNTQIIFTNIIWKLNNILKGFWLKSNIQNQKCIEYHTTKLQKLNMFQIQDLRFTFPLKKKQLSRGFYYFKLYIKSTKNCICSEFYNNIIKRSNTFWQIKCWRDLSLKTSYACNISNIEDFNLYTVSEKQFRLKKRRMK